MAAPSFNLLYGCLFLTLIVGCTHSSEKELAEILACETESGDLEVGGHWTMTMCHPAAGTLQLENVADGGSMTPPLVRIKWIIDELSQKDSEHKRHLMPVTAALNSQIEKRAPQQDSGTVKSLQAGSTVKVTWSRNEIRHLMVTVQWSDDAMEGKLE